MVATAVLLLVQKPPGAELVNELVLPRQIPVMPVIPPGSGVTVTTIEAAQPVEEYT
jgi:hypothetical protein